MNDDAPGLFSPAEPEAPEPFVQDGPGLFDEPVPAAPAPKRKPAKRESATPAPEQVLLSDQEPSAGPAPATGPEPSATVNAEPTPGPSPDPAPTASSAPAPAPAPSRPEPDRPEPPLALYRRYRPDVFADVIGQDHVTQPLRRALANNRVNHAYLFSGPRGCGKTSSARILARALNCEQGPTPDPCGQCDSCRDLATGGPGSIDVIEIDAASHGGVDDARDLRERAFFAPVRSRYKVYIVDEAHMVTTQGFNALLKLVEEPPPHVKFIFATTEPEKVIGTIRSRTHHYPFRLVPPRLLGDFLTQICAKEGVAAEPGVVGLVVRAGAGSVRDALSVLDQLLGGAGPEGVTYSQAAALLGYTPDSLLDDFVDALAAGDAQGVFATVDRVIEAGQDPRRFAEDLLRRLRDLIIVGTVPGAFASGLIEVPEDQARRYEVQARGLGAGELTRAAEVLAAGLTAMRGTTAPRLQLELMCARMLLPGADVAGRGLHARLDRLERRLDMPALGTELTGPIPVSRPPAARPSAPASLAPPAAPAAQPAAAAGQPGPANLAPPAAAAAGPAPSGPANLAPPAAAGPAPSGAVPAAPGERPAPAPSAQPGPANLVPPAAPAAPSGPTTLAPPATAGPAPSGPAAWPAPVPGAQPGPANLAPPAGGAASPAPAPGSAQPAPAWPTPVSAPTGPAGPAAPVPAPRAVVDPVAPAPGPAADGVVEAAEIRRHWPALLDAVAAKHRYTWMLLTQFAQVTDVLGKVLWLEFRDGGSRDGFMKQGAQDLQEAIAEQLGADMLVRARVESDPPPTAEGVLSVVASRPPAAPAGAAGPAGPAARGPAGPGRDRAQSPALAAVKTPVSGTSAARRSPSSPALSPASAAKPAEPIPDDVAPDDKVVPLKEQAKEAEALIVATFGAELVREEPNTKA